MCYRLLISDWRDTVSSALDDSLTVSEPARGLATVRFLIRASEWRKEAPRWLKRNKLRKCSIPLLVYFLMHYSKHYIFNRPCGTAIKLTKGFLLLPKDIVCLRRWLRYSEHSQVVDTTPTKNTYDTVRAEAPLIQSENGKCRLPLVSGWVGCTHTSLHRHDCTYRPHARAAWRVAVTASGKENYSHTSFCSFPALYKWFSCVLRDKYKTGKRHSCLHFQ